MITTVGIDLGTLTTKITLGRTHDFELVRNAHGGHTTPTVVTLNGPFSARLLGEDATEWSRADGNTVGMLDRLLVGATTTTTSLLSEDDGSNNNNPNHGDLDLNSGEDGSWMKFCRFEWRKSDTTGEAEGGVVYIPSMNEEYSPTALLAMLLGKIKQNVLATLHRLEDNNSGNATTNSNNETKKLHFVFAVPPNYPESTRNTVMDAAYAASIDHSSVVDSTSCMAAVYDRKFGDSSIVGQKKNALVVDMGHARTCITILQLGNDVEEVEGESIISGTGSEEEKKSNDEPTINSNSNSSSNNNNNNSNNSEVSKSSSSSKVKILSTVTSPTLGAGTIDILLYHHFLSTHPLLANAEFKPNSRHGQRLLEGCRKLKHLLSMLPEGNVMVETIGKNEMDVNLSASRELVKQLCQEKVLTKLKAMVKNALDNAGASAAGGGDGSTVEALGLGEEGISVVELTGGGCRIPMIQDAIREVTGKGDDFVFSKSFDDTSLAFGAAIVSPSTLLEEETTSATTTSTMDAERVALREKLLADEQAMAQRDTELLRKDEIRNQIEAHILELRSARHSKHSALLPSSDEFNSYLDSTDDWLFSDECNEATVEQMEGKWSEIQATTKDFCGEFLAAKKLEAERKDREMEEEAKRAAAERDAEAAMNGDDGGEEADHDTRRLPTKRRMEIVLKNKAEANELFSGGNYRHAAARYAKALTHCSKFYDLSPQEEQEVRDVKLSLYLNMAFAYIKLEKLDNAFSSCNDALAIDPESVKALYRRATVCYEKRKFDDAMKDLKEAEKLAPEDKAVKKLKLMVEKQVAKQKAKEKAMAKKMFG